MWRKTNVRTFVDVFLLDFFWFDRFVSGYVVSGGVDMYNKVIFVLCAVIMLVGCDQNVSLNLYMRDVNELLASDDEEKVIPIDVKIEILGTGIAGQCSRSEGVEVVEAVASVFEKASLIGCEKISGSMNDRMVISATTGVARSLDNKVKAAPYLIAFDVRKSTKSPKAIISVLFDSMSYTLLQSKIERITQIGKIDIRDATISITFNNDERGAIVVFPNSGTFVNGEPIDGESNFKLEPRQAFELKLGDVKTRSLSNIGWADALAISTEISGGNSD